MKLSREDSARHWTRVGVTEEEKDEDIVEDLRPQLLGREYMVLTPKRVVLEEVNKTLVHRSVQTDPMSLDKLEWKVDSLKGDMVNCMSSMFQYIEQLKELFVCLFVLRLNVPVNNFSVMSGRSQRFLGLTSTVGSRCALLKDTTR